MSRNMKPSCDRALSRLEVPGRGLFAVLAVLVLLVVGAVPAYAHARSSASSKPGKPTGVTVVAIVGGADVSWTAPAADGGSSITAYTVVTAPGKETCTTAGATTCTVSGLTHGRRYKVRVRAANAHGHGPASAPVAVPLVPSVSFGGPVTFTYPSEAVGLALSEPSTSTVQVSYTTADGPQSALFWGAWSGAASSFSPSSAMVTFAPGQTTAVIPFVVDPTTLDSGCGVYYVSMSICYPSVTVTPSSPTNALVGPTAQDNVFYYSPPPS